MLTLENPGWKVVRYISPYNGVLFFVDIYPIDDKKDHFLGDECWCDHKLEIVNSIPVVTHKAQDLREKPEAPKDVW